MYHYSCLHICQEFSSLPSRYICKYYENLQHVPRIPLIQLFTGLSIQLHIHSKDDVQHSSYFGCSWWYSEHVLVDQEIAYSFVLPAHHAISTPAVPLVVSPSWYPSVYLWKCTCKKPDIDNRLCFVLSFTYVFNDKPLFESIATLSNMELWVCVLD